MEPLPSIYSHFILSHGEERNAQVESQKVEGSALFYALFTDYVLFNNLEHIQMIRQYTNLRELRAGE